jgi:hypothetical protein
MAKCKTHRMCWKEMLPREPSIILLKVLEFLQVGTYFYLPISYVATKLLFMTQKNVLAL